MSGAVGHQFGVLAGEVLVVENLAFTAGDDTRVSLYAGDETVAVTGDGEAGVGPELGRLRVGGHICGALETDHSWKIVKIISNIFKRFFVVVLVNLLR